jgi:hypothetical protein
MIDHNPVIAVRGSCRALEQLPYLNAGIIILSQEAPS